MFKLFIVCACVHACMCTRVSGSERTLCVHVHTSACAHMSVEVSGQFVEVGFSLLPLCEAHGQAVLLGGKPLYPPSHPTGLQFFKALYGR